MGPAGAGAGKGRQQTMGESKGRRHNYEGMFLVSQAAAADFGATIEHIREIFNRVGAEVIAMRKWDDRRLAYEIGKQKRGVYFLTYFSCDPVNISEIERLCNLSETIMRVMMLRADHLTMEEMQAADDQQALADEAALRESKAEQEQAAAPSA